MSGVSQFARDFCGITPEHRDVFPAHDFEDVAVIHAKALHVSRSTTSERMNTLVRHVRSRAQAFYELEGTRNQSTVLAVLSIAVPPPNANVVRSGRATRLS